MNQDALNKIIEALRLLTEEKGRTTVASAYVDRAATLNNVLSLVGTFRYDPDNGQTFERWLRGTGTA